MVIAASPLANPDDLSTIRRGMARRDARSWGGVVPPTITLLAAVFVLFISPLPAVEAQGSTSAVQVLQEGNKYFAKVDLHDARVRPVVMIANNDVGGRQPLSQIVGRLQGHGYAEWLAVNGDLFSPSCASSGPHCGEGLTVVGGQDRTSAGRDQWSVRGSLGFDQYKNPKVAVGESQTQRHMTIAGGPRLVMGGGNPTCAGQWQGQTFDKTFFPSSGEWFNTNVVNPAPNGQDWCNKPRAVTLVGHSADGRYLYMGASNGGETAPTVAGWLKDRGAHEVLRMDSGGSSAVWHNGSFQAGTRPETENRPIANAFAIVVESAGPPPPPPATVRITQTEFSPSGSVSAGASVAVRVKAEPSNQIDAIRLLIDGAPGPEFGGAEATLMWNTGGYAVGSHSIAVQARARSAAGSWSGAATVTQQYSLNFPATPGPIVGDLNHDGKVNSFDRAMLVSNWSPAVDVCGSVADLNGDCRVNTFDWAILRNNWGRQTYVAGALTVDADHTDVQGVLQKAVSAQSTAALTLMPSTPSVEAGQTFTVAVNLNTGSVATDGTDAVLAFDPTQLSVVDVTNGSIYFDYPTRSTVSGRVEISGVATESQPFSGQGTLATVTFLARGGSGRALLWVDTSANRQTLDASVVEHGSGVERLSSSAPITVQIVPVATTFTVNSVNDAADTNPGDGQCRSANGSCPLRAAIMEANAHAGAEEIVLPAGIYTLTLAGANENQGATGDLNIRSNVTIRGAGADATIIDGNGPTLGDRLMTIGSTEFAPNGAFSYVEMAVSLEGLTLQHSGTSFAGSRDAALSVGGATITLRDVSIRNSPGGLANSFGRVTLLQSSIHDNAHGILNLGGVINLIDSAVDRNIGSSGRGIESNPFPHPSTPGLSQAFLLISGTSVTRNSFQGTNGVGAGVQNSGRATIVNSTISGNSASSGGGGIQHYALDGFPGAMSVSNVTIVGNTAPSASQILNAAVITLRNSIVATTGTPSCSIGVTSLGGNVESDNSCGLNSSGDRVNVDPRIGPLALTGGPTESHSLLAGSPAIDVAAADTCLSWDQRGSDRPNDGDGDGQARCDAGAVEAPALAPPPTPCQPRPRVGLIAAPNGDGRLRVTVTPGVGAIVRVRLGTDQRPLLNALVQVQGEPAPTAGGRVVSLPPGTGQLVLFVSRAQAGMATTAPMVITDDCGDWETFVGGGPQAF